MTTHELAKRIRLHCLSMTSRGRTSHIGSCLSIADILAVLYGGGVLRHDPARPRLPDRDRFILSKGHAGAALYATLAERGFFGVERLEAHAQNGSALSGHVSHVGVPGVEISTGSLGHGLSVGTGMALAARRDGRRHRVFVLLSDGELDEGSTWEPVLFAAHHGLDNLVALVDYNGVQSLAPVRETLELEPLAAKLEAFGWAVRECPGHDHDALREALCSVPFRKGAPSCLVCRTTKGKGVSFMEDQVLWHYRSPQGEELEAALAEVRGAP
ncbi:MAG TPA: transketolase [Longimicrobiales bacterium]|nr:transketolase [Longimicrobiales bacterium]